MTKILDYSEFKKIFESRLNEDSDDISKLSKEIEDTLSKIDLSDSDIKSAIAEVTGEKIEEIDLPEKLEEDVNEALLTLAGIALSAGKVTEMFGQGIKWSGKKLNVKGIENVGEAIAKGGHKYTHFIEEKLVKPALMLIPAYKDADKETQDKISKYVLIGVIGSLAVASGFELVNAIKEGHGLMAALEGTLVGAKAKELSQLVGEVVGNVVSAVH